MRETAGGRAGSACFSGRLAPSMFPQVLRYCLGEADGLPPGRLPAGRTSAWPRP
ncbi:hypothetical protein ACWCQS_31940 [Streptomyces sp. NPDC002076]